MTRIQLAPSNIDRLDPIALAIRWWTTQIVDVIGAPRRKAVTVAQVEATGSRLPANILVALGDTDGFAAHAVLPKGHVDAHRQALELQLPDLSPIKPDALTIAATAISRAPDGATTYAISMARRERLDGLEKLARQRGARSVAFHAAGHETPELLSPASSRRRQRSAIFDATIVAGIALSAVAAVMVWTNAVNIEAEALAQQERDLRGSAIAAQTALSEISISHALVERGVLKRRSYAALETLARLNAATPDSAWWSRIVWTPAEVTVLAQSQSAAAALATLSIQAKGWSIEPSGTLETGAGGGPQNFEFIAKPRQVRQK